MLPLPDNISNVHSAIDSGGDQEGLQDTKDLRLLLGKYEAADSTRSLFKAQHVFELLRSRNESDVTLEKGYLSDHGGLVATSELGELAEG